MQRTQIYLTERQRDDLAALARRAGKNQSELIREAVDRLLDRSNSSGRKFALARAAGMWRDRTDLPDLTTLRAEWDRK